MTAVIDGQLSIFDWMEDFDHAKEAKKAAKAGRKEEKTAEMNEETGAHEESAPGKHFKQ